MEFYKLNFILLYLIIGFSISLVSIYIFKKQYVGDTWGAILIASLGSFGGALLGTIISSNGLSLISILFSFAVSVLTLYIYGKINQFKH